MKKKDFYWVWKDSTRESILNQYYWDYSELMKTYKKINEALEYIDSTLTFNECEINDLKVVKEILSNEKEKL